MSKIDKNDKNRPNSKKIDQNLKKSENQHHRYKPTESEKDDPSPQNFEKLYKKYMIMIN